jgi:hypothetical protein
MYEYNILGRDSLARNPKIIQYSVQLKSSEVGIGDCGSGHRVKRVGIPTRYTKLSPERPSPVGLPVNR